MKDFKFFREIENRRLTVQDFTEFDDCYWANDYYDLDGSGWVTLTQLEELLRENPYGTKSTFVFL